MKTKILQVLRQNPEGFVSGQQLCEQLGVSRTAVWKTIHQLKEAGYVIQAVQNKGYHLLSAPDILCESEIASQLDTKWLGRSIRYFKELDSTNAEAKRIAEETDNANWHGTVVVADTQTAGRGRRGRSWSSPPGMGLFFTILLKPEIDPSNAPMLTLVKAMAVVKGIQQTTGLQPQIKWPNDIVINNKKICGILTEMSAEPDMIHYVVTGVGINVNQTEFAPGIKDRATSLILEKGEKVNRSKLVARVMHYFEKNYEVFEESWDLRKLKEKYNALLINYGQEVRVLDPKEPYDGIAHGINEKGELIVERKSDGQTMLVYAGEVSVRGVYGYAV